MSRNVRAILVVLAVAMTLALPGCLAPFRVHVDPQVLDQVDPRWTETPSGIAGSFPGTRTRETRYAFDSTDGSPPFSGTLQVFSLRGVDRLSVSQLLEHAKKLVANGAQENSLVLNNTLQEGERTLRSGIDTRWFVQSGRTEQPGPVFDDDVQVRILGEVGHDGRSNTSFLVVAMAQVGRTTQCGILPGCTPGQSSEITWIQLVGDGDGSVLGAHSSTGFIDNLVTR